MAYAQVTLEIFQHRKTKKVARLLKIDAVQVVGHLAGLWVWCWTNAPDGDLADCDIEDLAEAAMWAKDPKVFVDALFTAGFLDESPTDSSKYSIHDWRDHTGKILESNEKTKKRKARHKKKMQDRDVPETSPETSENRPGDVPETSPETFQERPENVHIKLKETKRNEINFPADSGEDVPPRKRGEKTRAREIYRRIVGDTSLRFRDPVAIDGESWRILEEFGLSAMERAERLVEADGRVGTLTLPEAAEYVVRAKNEAAKPHKQYDPNEGLQEKINSLFGS